MVELLRKLKRALVAWRERAKVRSEAARAFRYDRGQFMANAGALHLDRMVTDRLGLTEINRAIEMMLHGENICKIIIDPEK